MSASDGDISPQPLGGLLRFRGVLSVCIHAFLFAFAFLAAFGLYYNFRAFDRWLIPFYLPLLPAVILIKMLVYWRMKLFRGTWRYVGMHDLMSIGTAAWISTFMFVVFFFTLANFYPAFLQSRPQFPQSIFLLDFGMTIAAVCGARLLVRLYYEEIRPVPATGTKQCLIFGAGDTGEALCREIQRMPTARYRVVGFLDDDASKQGTRIHGVPILGKISEAKTFYERYQIEEILIAMPRAPQKTLRRIVEAAQGMNIRFRTIPAMEALIEGKVTVSQIRDVSIKDLLGREQVELDEAKIREYVNGQRVLITGAGGSIGSELCRQVIRYEPAKLILVEQAENNLFEIERELRLLAPNIQLTCYVADICDARRIDKIFHSQQPELIFHAAAHKHVPMMESNVGEAVKNNILGTKTIADAAKRYKVQRFVMISTDKAVNPTSVMGCTKRVAEMYIQQLRQDDVTQFMTVRFGNVLGSSGSVVPIFARQIASGGPVTVTDPEMTRYFMTIPEASQLVLQAGVIGKDGDIFVLDMGEPVKIVDLAREMITLSGLRPGEDIEIKFTGIRPGEKLYEELSVLGEDMGPTTHEKIYVWRNRQEDWPRVCRAIEAMVASADEASGEQIRRMLCDIVPEYRPSESKAASNPASSKHTKSSPEDATQSASHKISAVPYGESPVA